jgi:hypothetical protein
MILKTDSTSARVYREFYGKSEMPQSLCPYFWKLVVAWPITCILFPFTIVSNLLKIENGPHTPVLIRAFLGLVVYVCVYFAFSIGVVISSYWITYYEPTGMYFHYVNGVVSLVLLTTFSICALISTIYKKIKELKQDAATKLRYDENGNYIPLPERTPKQPSIIVSFIHASYNKYCPKIDWE